MKTHVMTVDEIMEMLPKNLEGEFVEAVIEADDDETLIGTAFWEAIRNVLEQLEGVTIAPDDE
jgi:hypothetical protein